MRSLVGTCLLCAAILAVLPACQGPPGGAREAVPAGPAGRRAPLPGAPPATASGPGVALPLAQGASGRPGGPETGLPAAPGRAAPAAIARRQALTTGAYLVRLAPGQVAARLLAHPALAGARGRGELALGRSLVVRVDPPAGAELSAWRAAVAAVPGVLGVTPEARRFRQQVGSSDPLVAQQWAHRPALANTPGAWSVVPVADQAKVVVAVLDSGLDVNHPEFAGRVVGARNVTEASPGSDVTDLEGHGTHVTGIIGADGADGNGVAGVAWGARLMPVKVFPDDVAGSDFEILAGFMYALRWRPVPDDGTRVRVLNLSLGSPTGEVSSLWLEAVQIARDLGVVVVVAAGNEAMPYPASPANTPGVLAVGSSTQYLGWEAVSAFSNGGERLDVVAPGEDILSTLPTAGSALGRTYGRTSGTSMAAPYAAGVAALTVARYDKDNTRLDGAFVDQVLARLRAAVTDLGPPGRDTLSGFGRLDARRAVAPPTLEAAP
ncbi:MAG: S8 family serine peptidase [Candidatus Sericytochromatia bacterium]|nr:S8 family serine peptidase [Candidatus Sericytochromatia bacterium]